MFIAPSIISCCDTSVWSIHVLPPSFSYVHVLLFGHFHSITLIMLFSSILFFHSVTIFLSPVQFTFISPVNIICCVVSLFIASSDLCCSMWCISSTYFVFGFGSLSCFPSLLRSSLICSCWYAHIDCSPDLLLPVGPYVPIIVVTVLFFPIISTSIHLPHLSTRGLAVAYLPSTGCIAIDMPPTCLFLAGECAQLTFSFVFILSPIHSSSTSYSILPISCFCRLWSTSISTSARLCARLLNSDFRCMPVEFPHPFMLR